MKVMKFLLLGCFAASKHSSSADGQRGDGSGLRNTTLLAAIVGGRGRAIGVGVERVDGVGGGNAIDAGEGESGDKSECGDEDKLGVHL
jgi:hypothetical protein